ncbi:CAP domain-containing protein, partial [Bradyrhizobium sp. JYMT SZCCT0428]|uniref:CAP domain-containing protein n=1 Tax=Bradyrhizobium sp. JYMT SZCCT0428 TaxID=2807673 RepID=UPI001BA503C9
MADPTAQEVLMMALINRARLDPAGEAARNNIDLNEGLAAGTLTAASKQPLAWSSSLFSAADAHSQAMIDADYFAHTDPNTGSTPQSRANAAGYNGGVSENIAWQGSTGAIDATATIVAEENSLFTDLNVAGRGHRTNLMDASYKQVGVGQVMGLYTQNGTTYNASMVTQDFGIPGGGGQFLTGIAYTDTDSNAFYSVGEGRGGVTVAISGGANQATRTAGDYSLAIGASAQTITFSGGGLAAPVVVNTTITGDRNALVNLVGQSVIETSTSLTEVSGVSRIIGLGTIGLALTGDAGGDSITGGLGNDSLTGLAG